MNKYISLILSVLLLVTIANFASAQEGSITILAVSENNGNITGSTADAYLELNEGKGRIFIETIPLSKLDTQISTRFAKQIACDYLNKECEDKDFIYTIKASTSIIGGPSASAAIAVLTTSLLDNTKIIDDISITGTINSGGLIGPVGGVKQKIEAAKNKGIKKVLIAKGSAIIKEDNKTINLTEYGNNLDMQIIEVSTLDEAYHISIGRKYTKKNKEIVIDKDYQDTMFHLRELLCNRSEELLESIDTPKENISINLLNASLRDLNNSNHSLKKSDYYSSASFCFSANTKLGSILIWQMNITDKDFENYTKDVLEKINTLDKKLKEKELKTITDLQTYMIVEERLVEARELIEKSIELKEEESNESLRLLAYALERSYSAITWSEFFDRPGENLDFNKEDLKNSCSIRIEEAKERLNYIRSVIPTLMESTEEQIKLAQVDYKNKDYELCLFKASKAKAEADVIFSALSVGTDQTDAFLKNRLKIIENNIAKQIEDGLFPILGYSYFEYSKSLQDKDLFSSMLFSQYALELSNLDIYFKKEKEQKEDKIKINEESIKLIVMLILGIILGILLSNIAVKRKKKKRRQKILRKRK